MDIGLVGKTALITGGSSGVGRAIALALAAEGTHIAIADLNKDDTLLQEIQALGAHAFYVPTDVSNESHINAMVKTTIAELGHLDLFINNMLIPGHFQTALTRGISAEHATVMRQQIPLRRLGSTEELAAAALLLLSDKLSPYTTGAELTVDGGLHLRPLPLYSDDDIQNMNQSSFENCHDEESNG